VRIPVFWLTEKICFFQQSTSKPVKNEPQSFVACGSLFEGDDESGADVLDVMTDADGLF
jgi:hypothetical protein